MKRSTHLDQLLLGITGILVLLTTPTSTLATSREEPPAKVTAGQASTSRRAGAWSDPATWDVVPSRDRSVIIRHQVTLDRPAETGRVEVQPEGALQLASTLHAYGSVTVYGKLLGSRGSLLFHVANDRLFKSNKEPGPDAKLPDYHPEDTGLWGLRGATIRLVGPEVTPWLNALPLLPANPTPAGYGASLFTSIAAGRARLATDPTGWEAGDTLLLTGLDGNYALATLRSQSGPDIAFSGADAFRANTLLAEERVAYPKVANLSRRLVIASADVREGDSNHRAHTAFLNCGCVACAGAPVELVNVEFRNLGPRGKLGRYPVHFHLLGDTQNRVRLEGSSIWQSVSEPGNRFVSVHATQGVTVRNNVALRSQGHGYFLESGPEINNTLAGNLSVDVRGPEELPVIQSTDYKQVREGTYHYWARAGNNLQGNVAVGPQATALVGMTTIEGKPAKPAAGSMVLLPHTVKGAEKLPSVSEGDEAYGSGKYGLDAAATNSRFVRPMVAYCQSSSLSDRTADGLQLVEPALLFNGETDAIYGSQLFANNAKDLHVQGGLLVGRLGLHVHYNSTLTLVGTRVRSQSLLHPTYWELGITMEKCDLQLKANGAKPPALFAGVYPPRRNAPGLLRLRNCTGAIETHAGSGSDTLSGDHALGSANFPGFEGTAEQVAGKRLTRAAAPSGFLKMPVSQNSRVAVVPQGGDLSGSGRYWGESEARWRATLATTGGYPEGLPPGTYDVRYISPTGQETIKRGVVIRSETVTDFAALP